MRKAPEIDSESSGLRRAKSAGSTRSQALAGTNIESAHFHNQRVVLETVRIYGPLSRAEISSHTCLTSQTISNIVDKLLDHGTLVTRGRRSGQRGQPAIELDINPHGGYAVGLHLDRDHLTGVLLDLAGTIHQVIHEEWDFPTPAEALPRLSKTALTLIRKQELAAEDVWGVGVGLPGPLDMQAGSLVNPPNFPGWSGVPLRALLSEELNLPVFLETDATAAAVGERWFGQGRDLHNFFYVFFGIGLGGGMILDGKPYRGEFGNAAMFGHVPVEPNGSRCGCGGIGCLELYTSLASLYAAFQRHGYTVKHVNELDALLGSRGYHSDGLAGAGRDPDDTGAGDGRKPAQSAGDHFRRAAACAADRLAHLPPGTAAAGSADARPVAASPPAARPGH